MSERFNDSNPYTGTEYSLWIRSVLLRVPGTTLGRGKKERERHHDGNTPMD